MFFGSSGGGGGISSSSRRGGSTLCHPLWVLHPFPFESCCRRDVLSGFLTFYGPFTRLYRISSQCLAMVAAMVAEESLHLLAHHKRLMASMASNENLVDDQQPIGGHFQDPLSLRLFDSLSFSFVSLPVTLATRRSLIRRRVNGFSYSDIFHPLLDGMTTMMMTTTAADRSPIIQPAQKILGKSWSPLKSRNKSDSLFLICLERTTIKKIKKSIKTVPMDRTNSFTLPCQFPNNIDRII